MAKGWHRESKRHSLAARGVETSSSSKINSNFHSSPEMTKSFMYRDGKKVLLKDEKGDVLASLKVTYDSDTALRIEAWKAKKKGHGYGKELMRELLKAYPNVTTIATDGLSEMGARNIEKALPNFKIIEWRRSGAGGMAMLMRQDAIDYFVEQNQKGVCTMFRFGPSGILNTKRLLIRV
jgi:hypothetical protein